MTLSLSQIMSWDPSVLTEIGNGWTNLGSKVEDLFTRYRSSVVAINGGHWEGAAADAAVHRAESDQRAAHQLVGHLNRAAKVATDGFAVINEPLQRTRTAVAEATNAGYLVREDLSVYKPGKSTEDDEKAMRRFAERITSAANATEAADASVKNALSATRGDLRAAFTSAAALGGAQARADAKDILKDPSHLTPEELQRLAAAGSLTPEQLDALQAGDEVNIPASQMEYLNGLARSLDGKTPDEIEAILNALPGDARHSVANALQLVSNERVTSNIAGDKDIPTTGGLALLPDRYRQSLSRGDLVVTKSVGLNATLLNGVKDNQSIARVAGMAEDRYKAGSALDQRLMDVGRQYLHAQVRSEQDFNGLLSIDANALEAYTAGHSGHPVGVTEDIFRAVAPDKIALHDAVLDPSHGQDFVTDLLTHRSWGDGGAAAKALFTFNPDEQFVHPGESHAGYAMAARDGEIMQAVAQAMSTDAARNLMLDVPGSNHHSVGQLNPELMRQVASSMAPYIPDMAGASAPPDRQTAGFHVGLGDHNWTNADGRHGGLVNIMSIMDSDLTKNPSHPGAGEIFNAGAVAAMTGQEGLFAHDPHAPNAGSHLIASGIIQGALDQGLMTALQHDATNHQANLHEVWQHKKDAWDTWQRLAGLAEGEIKKAGPFGKAFGYADELLGDQIKDGLKNDFVGKEPDKNVTVSQLPAPNWERLYNQTLAQVPGTLSPELRAQYPWAFGGDGHLLNYEQALANAELANVRSTEVANTYKVLLNSLSDDAWETFSQAYAEVTGVVVPKG
ncbi:TPR repeat region-containing protein [Mycobacterium sp. ML4]